MSIYTYICIDQAYMYTYVLPTAYCYRFRVEDMIWSMPIATWLRLHHDNRTPRPMPNILQQLSATGLSGLDIYHRQTIGQYNALYRTCLIPVEYTN